ncbi:hypothetical protein MAR_016321 [Mya arenaria]|uniref:Uncharacterized protein n=1 Tax=Mya arenaria TaxID=6604 RepID=A0ABY7FMR5_MYAAR|nr:hypothetical protein MAR_016321 [Mya arenaria]
MSKQNQDIQIIQDHDHREDFDGIVQDSLPADEQNCKITAIVEEQERTKDEIDKVGSMHDYENEQNSDEGKELMKLIHKTTQENECANESRVDIETNIVLLAHTYTTEHTIELTEEKAEKESSKEEDSVKVDTRTEHHMNNNRTDNTQNNHDVETAADDKQVNNDQVN